MSEVRIPCAVGNWTSSNYQWRRFKALPDQRQARVGGQVTARSLHVKSGHGRLGDPVIIRTSIQISILRQPKHGFTKELKDFQTAPLKRSIPRNLRIWRKLNHQPCHLGISQFLPQQQRPTRNQDC
jgi:hypothetical protein